MKWGGGGRARDERWFTNLQLPPPLLQVDRKSIKIFEQPLKQPEGTKAPGMMFQSLYIFITPQLGRNQAQPSKKTIRKYFSKVESKLV